MFRFATAALGVALAAGSALGQSASVSFSASSTSAAPGDTITVTLVTNYSTGGAGTGAFGAPGLYGFGGNVLATGDLAAEASGASPANNPALTSGSTASTATGLVRAGAGRGLNGGLGENPSNLLVFDVTIDAGSPDGTFSIDYDGAVVLAVGNTLETFSTDPGPNQGTLSVTPLTITVAAGGGFCIADVNTTNTNPGDPGYGTPDGTVDGADLSFYVENWLNQNAAVADVNTTNTNPGDAGYGAPDGTVDGADLSYYVEQWLAGSNGAGCP